MKPLGPLGRLGRRALQRSMSAIRQGRLRLLEGDREWVCGEATPEYPVSANVFVRDPSFYRDTLLGGTVGAAESFMDGAWDSDDLVSVVRILVRNLDAMSAMEGGAARLLAPVRGIYHALRRNTREGSRRNIAAHYDLGNDFFAQFLDETMTYSCGVFPAASSTLKEASEEKYDRICRKLALGPRDRVLEIGGGWGGFAVHAAGKYGCRVDTTTISRRQFEFAERRVRDAGLAGRVHLHMADYRDLAGTYDKLVSIEMIEAVGHHYLGEFFAACGRLLGPRGAMALQAITIRDQVTPDHRESVDFIKRYIFPGSYIPSISEMTARTAQKSDLQLCHLEDLTPHYARTLNAWRMRFQERAGEIRAMGYPDAFLRMWEFYFAYCEGSFREHYNGSVQMVFRKPLSPLAAVPPLPSGAVFA
ncbi:MAG: cyclopropane-fatty-acyl-phospholipid synthase [Deltaproteobacteria bacterium]|nr:cyclopropane-fatty-acyl-phospholipid synthase [Deltaproteobacteria bacterium]